MLSLLDLMDPNPLSAKEFDKLHHLGWDYFVEKFDWSDLKFDAIDSLLVLVANNIDQSDRYHHLQ